MGQADNLFDDSPAEVNVAPRRIILRKIVHRDAGLKIDVVLPVFEGAGSENVEPGQVWVECPRKDYGYVKLNPGEYEFLT